VPSDKGAPATPATEREPGLLLAPREEEEEDEEEEKDKEEEAEEEVEAEEEKHENQKLQSRPLQPITSTLPPQVTFPALTPTAKNQARRDAETDPTHKFCTLCLEDLPLISYTINFGSIFGQQSRCTACNKSSIRQRRAISTKIVESENEGKGMEEQGDEEVQKEREEPQDRHFRPTGATLPLRTLVQTATAKNQARRDVEAGPTHKFCTRCLQDLPLTTYNANSNGIFGLHSQCKACQHSARKPQRVKSEKYEEDSDVVNEKEKEDEVEIEYEKQDGTFDPWSLSSIERSQAATAKNQERRDVDAKSTHKYCTRCLQDLPFASYTFYPKGIFGRQPRCKRCQRGARKPRRPKQGKDEESSEAEDEEEEDEDEGGDEDKEEEENVDSRSLSSAKRKRMVTAKNQARRDTEADPTHKFCVLCLQDTPLADYSFHSIGIFGRHARCKACKNSSVRQLRAKHAKDRESPGETEEEEESEEEEEGHGADSRSLTPAGRKWEARRSKTADNEVDPCPTKKCCTGCLKVKELENYYRNSHGYLGRRAR
jgi:hypothetical protein